jgi:plasmid stability protein
MPTLNIKKFPDDLYEQLRMIAEQEQRSLSQEVIYLLRQAVSSKERRSLLELRGLGKKLWEEVNVGDYLENERNTWDQQ